MTIYNDDFDADDDNNNNTNDDDDSDKHVQETMRPKHTNSRITHYSHFWQSFEISSRLAPMITL